MRYFFFSVFILFNLYFAKASYSVDKNNLIQQDSISVILQNEKLPETERLHQLKSYVNKKLDQSQLLNEEELTTIADFFLKNNLENSSFHQVIESQTKKALEKNNIDVAFNAYLTTGEFFESKNQLDSAFYYYRKGYQQLNNLNDGKANKYVGLLLLNMAYAQESAKDYINAENSSIRALQHFKELGEPENIFKGYNILAITQNGLNEFEKSIEYHLKAKNVLSEIEDAKTAEIYGDINSNNIASTNLRAKNFQQAIVAYNELLEDKKRIEKLRPSTLAKALSGKVYAQLQLGNFTKEKILKNLDEARSIADSLGYKYYLALINYNYAEAHLKFGEKNKALEYALISKQQAEESDNTERLLEVLQFLSSNNFENSSQYAKQSFDLSERLTADERAIQEKFARIQYETEETEQQNIALTRQRKIWIGIALALLLIGFGTVVIIAQRKANQRLKFERVQQKNNQEIYNLMLSQQGKLEEGKKSEQKRISEELHDSVLGQMLGIRLILSGLNERGDQEAIDQRSELIEKLQGVEEEIRLMSHELSASAYEQVDNFLLSIQELLQTFETASKINFTFEYDKDISWNLLEGDVKINIYRIIQESIKNSIKHAKCKNIKVELNKKDNDLVISVTDDGKGFNPEKSKKGIGLKNIISRTEKINGYFSVESSVGKGAKITVTFPLERPLDNQKTSTSFFEKRTKQSQTNL